MCKIPPPSVVALWARQIVGSPHAFANAHGHVLICIGCLAQFGVSIGCRGWIIGSLLASIHGMVGPYPHRRLHEIAEPFQHTRARSPARRALQFVITSCRDAHFGVNCSTAAASSHAEMTVHATLPSHASAPHSAALAPRLCALSLRRSRGRDFWKVVVLSRFCFAWVVSAKARDKAGFLACDYAMVRRQQRVARPASRSSLGIQSWLHP